MHPENLRAEIRGEYEERRARFHALLDSLAVRGWDAASANPGWTNGQIATHMAFGFWLQLPLLPLVRLAARLPRASTRWFAWLLNASTVPFNWVNAAGARAQASLVSSRRLGRLMDGTISRLMRMIDSVRDEEMDRGMYFPSRWDAVSFREFMTVAEVLRYPVAHFDLHLHQIRGER